MGDAGADDAAYTIYQYKFAATHLIFFGTVLVLVLVGLCRSHYDASAGRHATNTINAVFSAHVPLLVATLKSDRAWLVLQRYAWSRSQGRVSRH